MAGEIKINDVSIATESGGTVTLGNATLGSTVVLGTNASPIASNLVLAAGNGIDFSAASGSAAGSSSAVLNDYEEGTFQPEVYDAASGGNQLTSNSNYGAYTKIGNLVTIYFNFSNIVTNGATAGNTVIFRNLPFTAQSVENHGTSLGAVVCDRIINGGFLSAISQANANYARILKMGNNVGDTYLEVQDIGTSGASDISFSLTYRVV